MKLKSNKVLPVCFYGMSTTVKQDLASSLSNSVDQGTGSTKHWRDLASGWEIFPVPLPSLHWPARPLLHLCYLPIFFQNYSYNLKTLSATTHPIRVIINIIMKISFSSTL